MWPAPGLDDTWLSKSGLPLELHRGRNNSIIDLESFEDNVSKLTNYCYDEKNFKAPIMEAFEQVLGGGK
jgi:hypothetical protein